MKILIAILIFSGIVLIHELGHFLLAKKNGIVVTEFSLGMGPRLVSTVRGGTRYSVKVLPIGGSCAMLGEDTDEDTLKGSFNAAPVWGRISVVAAGPVFNFILAFLLSVIIVGFVGYNPAEILQVTEGSAAEAAGLRAGDIVTEYQGYHIDLGKDLYLYSYLNPLEEDEVIHITYERDGEEYQTSFVPDVNVRYLLGLNRESADTMKVASLIEGMPLEEAGVKPGDVITGINGVDIPDGAAYDAYIKEHPLSDEPVEITYMRDGLEYEATLTPAEYRTPDTGFAYRGNCVKASGFEVLKYGALEVKYMIRTTVMSLKELLTGGLGMDDLSGPVGVVDAIGTTYEESKSQGTLMIWMNMLYMAVLLSANLGVMNLLPFPALDGGRLVFLILEAIRRKPVNRQIEGMVHFAGLMFLMALMLVVMYHDIVKIL
ncbi:MAG: RIP metalloprotease RseP [Eubacteriales bacterium]|nr:RIP metalloprotease RseP [Eubacteriales bacterium]